MKVVNIATDGLPNMDDPKLVGRIAFIFDGCVISGWPLKNGNWEANEDVGRHGQFANVKKYIIFDEPVWCLSEDERYPLIDNDATRFSEWLMENCELAEDNSLWSYKGEDYTQQGLYKIYRSEIESGVQIIQADRKLGRLAWKAMTTMFICGATIVGWGIAKLLLQKRFPILMQDNDKPLMWIVFIICLISAVVYMYCITKAMIQEYKQIITRNEAKHQEYLDQEQEKYNKHLEEQSKNFGGL